ncbi:MAG: hypothetical protein ABFR89_03515 [Actinomycetota bacterium]
MRPDVPQDLLDRAAEWDELHRWERSELGKALRRLGLTYGEIREFIPVPKSTLSYWCRDIELTADQVAAIRRRSDAKSRAGIPVDTQWKRREKIAAIEASARAHAHVLVRTPLWLAGVVMYWAEGSKTKRDLEMVNTDPAVLRLFIKWVRTHHGSEAEFVLSLHLHEGNDEAAAKLYWEDELGLPGSGWYKTFIKPKGTGHRKNHLPWGVCRVRVKRSTDAFVRTMAWIDELREIIP